MSTETSTVTSVESGAGWTAVGAASIPAAVNDALDTTYAQSPSLTTTYQPIKMKLGTLGAGDLAVKVRLSGDNSGGARVRLMQGTSVIATWTITALPATATEYSFSLTTAQAATVTDRTNLSLEIAGTL